MHFAQEVMRGIFHLFKFHADQKQPEMKLAELWFYCWKDVFYFQGVERAANIRWFTGKFLMIGFAIYATAYYFKYNAHVSTGADRI